MLVVDSLLVLILISVWAGMYQIVKQQGRIILRLEKLESQSGAEDEPDSPLTVGEAFPAFALPDLDGKTVELAQSRGKPVLLIHWSPACGYCESIMPDLAALECDYRKQGIRMVYLALEDAKANRDLAHENGVTSPVLLLGNRNAPEPFANMGTPVAYMLDASGRVSHPRAIGADEVVALARSVVPKAKRLPGEKALTQSRIERDGLKAGSAAPDFELPDIHGGRISLSQYRGRRALLVFSDPNCGPCDAIAPQLAQFHREHGDEMALIMVGRGSVDENRRKARQFGLEFPIVLQDKWKVSKQYGIFATPVAFLIGENGIILNDVAKGAGAIGALAQAGLIERKELQHESSS